MPRKRRTNKKRTGLTDDEAAWLRGDRDSGFVEFKPDDELHALWMANGDRDSMRWVPGMSRPDAK